MTEPKLTVAIDAFEKRIGIPNYGEVPIGVHLAHQLIALAREAIAARKPRLPLYPEFENQPPPSPVETEVQRDIEGLCLGCGFEEHEGHSKDCTYRRPKAPSPDVSPARSSTVEPSGKIYDKTEEHDMSGKMPPILFQDGRFQTAEPTTPPYVSNDVGEHDSDCAIYNGPALEPGPCDCAVAGNVSRREALKSESSGPTLKNDSKPHPLPSDDVGELTRRLIAENQDKWRQALERPDHIGWFVAQAMKATSGRHSRSAIECEFLRAALQHQSEELERVRDCLSDLLGFLRGEISGPYQLDGILKEARASLGQPGGDGE